MADVEVMTFGPFEVNGTMMASVERVAYLQGDQVRVVWERFSCDVHWDRYPPTPLPIADSG